MTTFFLLQYSFLNGWILQRFFLKDRPQHWLTTAVLAMVLSLSFNSLLLYVLIRTLAFPLNTRNIIIFSVASSVILLIAGLLLQHQKRS